MDVLHIEGLFYYQKHHLDGLDLHENFDWRAMGGGARQTVVVLWYKIVCVYYKLVHASLFGVQLHMTIKLTYTL